MELSSSPCIRNAYPYLFGQGSIWSRSHVSGTSENIDLVVVHQPCTSCLDLPKMLKLNFECILICAVKF